MREHRGSGTEQDPAQVICCRLHAVRLLLVLCEPADAVQDPVFITGARPPQDSSPAKRPALALVHWSILFVTPENSANSLEALARVVGDDDARGAQAFDQLRGVHMLAAPGRWLAGSGQEDGNEPRLGDPVVSLVG